MWPTLSILLLGVLYLCVQPAASQGYFSCVNPSNQDGVCINIRQCQPLLRLLLTQGHAAGDFLRASVCGYEGRDPRVCCPSGTNPATETDNPRTSKEVQTTPYGPLFPPDCGVSSGEHIRVVGGVPALLGTWPWITALGYVNKKDPSQPKWLCGGSLISRRHVLTAGHCVHRRDDLYIVRIGDLDLNSKSDGAEPVEVLIEKKILHPSYNPTSYTSDIAMLRLQEDVPFSKNIRPICLPVTNPLLSDSLERTNPFIAGWGSVYFNGPSSNRLLEAQVTVVSTERCKNAFQNFKTTMIDDRVICAENNVRLRDACQGDSGGPLMFPSKTFFHVVGVISYGYKCAERGFPGVYSRVTAFLDFILENLV